MSKLTKLIATCCLTAIFLLLASIYVHNADGFPKYLDTSLALAGGFIGLMSSLFGFASTKDNKWS